MLDKRNTKLLSILLVVLIIVIVFNFVVKFEIAGFILNLLSALFPFFIAFFISWLMKPLGSFLHRKLKINLKMANFLAVLLNFIVIFGFFFVLIPIFIIQFVGLIQVSDELVANLQSNFNYLNDLYAQYQDEINEFINTSKEFLEKNTSINFSSLLSSVSSSVSSTLFSVVTVFFKSIFSVLNFLTQILVAYIIAFYFINDINSFTDKTLHFVLGKKYPSLKPMILDVSRTLFSYLRGLLLDCSIVAIAVAIGCYFMGLPSAIFLGLLAGILNVIPYLGPVLGGLPIFFIALSQSWVLAIISLVLVFGVQFVEANFLQPKIMASATSLHPASVIVGLLIMASLFGFVGMIISTPLLAVINVILKYSKYDIHI